MWSIYNEHLNALNVHKSSDMLTPDFEMASFRAEYLNILHKADLFIFFFLHHIFTNIPKRILL